MDDEKRIYFGGAVKALGDGVIEGMLVPFTSAEVRDFHKEWFSSERTNLYLEDYPLDGIRTLYHHGLDPTIGIKTIGKIIKAAVNDVGAWVQAQLNLADEYEQMIYELARQGKLAWSSGALPQSVRVAPDGCIEAWACIEASLTPTPAMPQLTKIRTLKALLDDDLEETESQSIEAVTPEPSTGDLPIDNQDVVTDDPVTEETKMNPLDKLRELLMQLLEQLNMQVTPEEVPVMETAMEEEFAKADSPEVPDEELQKAILKSAFARLTAHRESKKAFVAGIASELRNQPGTPKAKMVGAFTNGSNGNGGNVQAPAYVPNMRVKSRYGNLTPEALSCLFDTQNQYRTRKGLAPFLPGGNEEGFGAAIQVMANHAVEAFDNGKLRYNGDHYAKALNVRSMKANEIDHTTQSGFGSDWIWTLWREQIIEKARRENVVMPQFKTIPMDANTEIHPVEWTDPTVYFVPETTSSTQIDRSTSAIPLSKLGTKNLTFVTKKFGLRTDWSAEQEEDAIVNQAERTQVQSDRAMRDALDYILLSGDETTGAATNINYSGTNPVGDERWLAADGLMHLPLIVGTGLAIDNATAGLLLTKIREARFSLGSEFNTSVDDIIMFTDSQTYQQMLNLDEFITMDKAGALATAQKGQIGFIDGIAVFVSSQMGLSHTNGKISSTANENVYGRIAFMYKPYWYLGVRRQITPFLSQADDGESWQLSLTSRVDVQTHPQNNGSSLLYAINV